MMFDSYCKTVIKNCVRRYWKRKAKRSEHEYLVADAQLSIYPTDKDAFAEKYIITCGNVQAIFHCFALFTAVEQLKEKEKTVVVLKYWGGYTDKYIAQYLSVTERTVRNLKSRAYIALKIIRIFATRPSNGRRGNGVPPPDDCFVQSMHSAVFFLLWYPLPGLFVFWNTAVPPVPLHAPAPGTGART